MGENRHFYKGFMLDVCRHYMPVEDIKRLLRAAQFCGVNKMHWHLADDQGWRIEIKKYPRLTQVGAVRGDSFFGAVSETEHNCGFYTQEQAKDIVAYAQDCGIDVIPEIEIPGHAGAMLAAYPEFGCRRTVVDKDDKEQIIEEPYRYQVETEGGIFPHLICAGKDASVDFLKDILDEVSELFPYPAVHIGGDEALKQHWRRCPDCRRRMRENGLAAEEELQRWLVLEMGAYLKSKGKDTIVYNDSLAGGMLPDYFIVQHWMGNQKETTDFMKAGGRVIYSDVEYCYLDYAYSAIDVRNIYEAPVIPIYAKGCEEGLLGIECMLWTERITNIDRAAYLLFPRLPAFMLKFRENDSSLTWEIYLERLRDLQEQIGALGLHGAPETEWVLDDEAAALDRERDQKCRTAGGAQEAIRQEERLLLQEELEKLLTEIDMPRPFALRVMDEAWKALPKYCGTLPETGETEGGDGAAEMTEQLLTALKNRESGAWRELPREVWLDTMKCFSRFVREYRRSYGRYGFDRGFWTVRQINAKLFRIGELEYECREADGKKEVDIHIPSDAQLRTEELRASVKKARAFLTEWFPEWEEAPMMCTSWLLSPRLRELLPKDSNILNFRRAFELTEMDAEPDDVLEWVFGVAAGQRGTVSLADLPEGTTLQKNMKAFLADGGKVGVATGRLTNATEWRGNTK